MSKSDTTHFDDYRPQTAVKHAILNAYLPAYFDILGSLHNRLVYIDGFAGPGSYSTPTGDTFDGSPAHALRLVAQNAKWRSRVYFIFVEQNKQHAQQLERVAKNICEENPDLEPPVVACGTFADEIGGLLDHIDEHGYRLAPTFLFADPCGIKGASHSVIGRLISRPGCEAFIFFNFDAVRRVLGAIDKPSMLPVLRELFGDDMDIGGIADDVASTNDSFRSEQIIINKYQESLSKYGARFTLPFRIEYEHRRATSHYLIHATKHPKGFSVMKHAMWKATRETIGRGSMEFRQASEDGSLVLLDADLTQMQHEILSRLSDGPAMAREFKKDWTARPSDRFTDSMYLGQLIQLEADGKIEVWDRENKARVPMQSRRKITNGEHKGKPTVPDDNWIRLAK